MAIFQGDLTIKTAIELGLEDMRKNPWLIDDAMSDIVENPYLKDKYGQKQIDAMKEWFANNQIDIYMRSRNDKDRLPCVTITMGASQEKDDMKHMADQSTESVMLFPQDINKPINYVVKPFAFTSYDPDTGELEVDPSLKGMDVVAPGMLVVDPDTGKAFIIQEIGPGFLQLEEDLEINAARLAIIPKFQHYVARREHSFFQESYTITCHAHGDPQTLLWLWTIVTYSILRYRESMLEAYGFTQSSISSGLPDTDPYFSSPGGETVWVRSITLSGMVENSWIKTPRRVIESVGLREKTGTVKGYRGGIKILSNSEPEVIEEDLQNWFAINEDDES